MTFTYLFSQVKYFITWFRKFTLCKASKNATNCVETETPKWTWDMWQKDFDPSLHKNMSPFWWTKKRGLFLPPSLPYGPMSPSQQFFFLNASLTGFQVLILSFLTLWMTITVKIWMNTFSRFVTLEIFRILTSSTVGSYDFTRILTIVNIRNILLL